MSDDPPLTADAFLALDRLTGDEVLTGKELVRLFWVVKGREKERARKEAFWGATNAAVEKAYRQLEETTRELDAARAELQAVNARLEERVAEQVEEIVQHTAEVEALNVQLRLQVLERSRELAEALATLESGPSRDALGPGAVLADRYRILRQIGRGGMGVVFAGEDNATGSRVALKVVRPQIGRDPRILRRFVHEASAAASVDDRRIVRTRHVDLSDDGRLYLVMDFVDGVTLKDLVRAGRTAPGPSARIGAGIAEALAGAHAAGVVHRDIKPSNVMLSRQAPLVRVLDFGLSKFPENQSADSTRVGAMVGTPPYMSPEQVRDASAVTAATDVYSLGITLHQVIDGKLPFDADSTAAWCMAHLQEAPAELPATVPRPLRELVLACLQKDPASRPTARALAAALTGIANDLAAPEEDALALPILDTSTWLEL